MKSPYLIFALSALMSLCLSACGGSSAKKNPGQAKEVTTAVAAQANSFMSEAGFAVQIRDWARADETITKALDLRSDFPEWWELRGFAQKQLGKTGDARSSYKKALSLWEDYYKETKDVQFGMRQILALVLLDRVDEARSLLDTLSKKHATDSTLQQFIRSKGIDRMLTDPDIKQKKL